MIPARRPRLFAQQHALEASAAHDAAEKRAGELAAQRKAEAIERDRARKRRANHPVARFLEEARGWALSILGALLVSLLLTYLVNHPKSIDYLVATAKALLHIA
jgi:hypothetical protein